MSLKVTDLLKGTCAGYTKVNYDRRGSGQRGSLQGLKTSRVRTSWRTWEGASVGATGFATDPDHFERKSEEETSTGSTGFQPAGNPWENGAPLDLCCGDQPKLQQSTLRDIVENEIWSAPSTYIFRADG